MTKLYILNPSTVVVGVYVITNTNFWAGIRNNFHGNEGPFSKFPNKLKKKTCSKVPKMVLLPLKFDPSVLKAIISCRTQENIFQCLCFTTFINSGLYIYSSTCISWVNSHTFPLGFVLRISVIGLLSHWRLSKLPPLFLLINSGLLDLWWT